MRWFSGKKKETKPLEERVRDAIVARKIPIIDGNSDYSMRLSTFDIIGVGNSKDDSEEALKRFINYLKSLDPVAVSSIKIDSTTITGFKRSSGFYTEPRLRIYALGYKLREADYTSG